MILIYLVLWCIYIYIMCLKKLTFLGGTTVLAFFGVLVVPCDQNALALLLRRAMEITS